MADQRVDPLPPPRANVDLTSSKPPLSTLHNMNAQVSDLDVHIPRRGEHGVGTGYVTPSPAVAALIVANVSILIPQRASRVSARQGLGGPDVAA
jgi:hypothetical protein